MSEKVNGALLLREIEGHLVNLEFVQWDRYVSGIWADDLEYIVVYGWIDREDNHEDYVQIIYWDNGNRMFTTSSEEYTYDIHSELFDESPEEHNDCKRVENAVEIPNMVEL